MKCYGVTDKGNVRADNQDSFLIVPCEKAKCNIVCLCDGMGGAKAGGIASQLSDKRFTNYIYNKLIAYTGMKPVHEQILRDACDEVNEVAFDYTMFDESCEGMGTTLVGGVVTDAGEVHLVNVGDSRAYHISLSRRKISQITKDHSLVEHLVDVGIITREEARTHPQKNVITRAVGSEPSIECDYYFLQLKAEDILLLCSDGLSNIITDEEILSFAAQYSDPEQLCKELLKETLSRDAGDNVTVVAVMK